MQTPGDRREFGELEQRVLAALWVVSEPLTVAQVLDALDGDVVYTTVAKVLDRLHAKGAVLRSRSGRSFSYRPVADEAATAASRIRALLERAGDREAVLHGFADGLQPQEAEQLINYLRAVKKRQAR